MVFNRKLSTNMTFTWKLAHAVEQNITPSAADC